MVYQLFTLTQDITHTGRDLAVAGFGIDFKVNSSTGPREEVLRLWNIKECSVVGYPTVWESC